MTHLRELLEEELLARRVRSLDPEKQKEEFQRIMTLETKTVHCPASTTKSQMDEILLFRKAAKKGLLPDLTLTKTEQKAMRIAGKEIRAPELEKPVPEAMAPLTKFPKTKTARPANQLYLFAEQKEIAVKKTGEGDVRKRSILSQRSQEKIASILHKASDTKRAILPKPVLVTEEGVKLRLEDGLPENYPRDTLGIFGKRAP